MSDERLIHRVQAEYLEMPCMRLTQKQAQRLFGLDERTCAQVLSDLVRQKFLARRPDGSFVRASEWRPSSSAA